MNENIKIWFDFLKERFNREVSRALRSSDEKALRRANEIRAEASGAESMIALLITDPEEAARNYRPIREWLNSFYNWQTEKNKLN